MDSRVDLTIRRDFKGNSKINNSMFDVISRHLNKSKCPWKKPKDLEPYKDSDYQYYNVLIIGNKKQRKDFKWRRYINSNICEKCGSSLEVIPWRRARYNLCKSCIEELYGSQEDRICWKELRRLRIND